MLPQRQFDTPKLIFGWASSLLLGLISAGIAGWLMSWLWQPVALSVFVAVLFAWTLSVVTKIIQQWGTGSFGALTYRDNRKGGEFSWQELKAGNLIAWVKLIYRLAVYLVAAFISAIVTAALLGLIVPGLRWQVFFVAQGVWLIVVAATLISDWKKIKP